MSSNTGHVVLLHAEHGDLRFTIETEGAEVGGYFLWVKREDGSDLDEQFEDSVDRCQVLALKKYGVPLSSWR
jgi:hypothetical protein